jgi:hypothetical protein
MLKPLKYPLMFCALCAVAFPARAQPATPQEESATDKRLRALENRILELETPPPPPVPVATDPFSYGDFTWLNGNSRQHKRVLDTPYFTPQIDMDVNYTASNWHPNDNTVVGSTSLARNNEVELNFLGVGGDLHYGNVRGRFILQFGTRSTVVPRNDFSVTRGQFDLANAYRYISEAYGGYHLDILHGVNVDVGIFMSYVGLNSYDNFENWVYQPSFTSDNTPWFFNGMRIQAFLTDRLKVELWLINGWQTYGKFNNWPGVGAQVAYRPWEFVSFVSNNYVGTDTSTKEHRYRFHSDDSFQLRYLNLPGSLIDKAAFSITVDVGLENGDGVTALGGSDGPAQRFISGMVYNRVWLFNDRVGWTVGGGIIHNPGRYLALLPTGQALAKFDTSPGTQFDGWDASTTFDLMPMENITWRLEFVHRETKLPYFAGTGGVTSPDGYVTTAIPEGWVPDQRTSETRMILAMLFRL